MTGPMVSAANGSRDEFDQNWKNRKEADYNHWAKGRPKNQIQLAFSCHWQVFTDVYPQIFKQAGKVLEVGCGRGSISSHFAERGWQCTLLDYSQSVLDRAKHIFNNNNHRADFITGDARTLPIDDNQYHAVVSIGLLEHFEDIDTLIKEQYRILKPGGVFLAYVVPERPDNIQQYFNWLNRLIKGCYRLFSQDKTSTLDKEEIYRSDHYSERYLDIVRQLDVTEVKAFGMYPLPMLSHSPEFPFSLMSPWAEQVLTWAFRAVLALRRLVLRKHGWMCSEKMGQAFLIGFIKN